MRKVEQYVISSTYLKKNDPTANAVELTIVVKDTTGVEDVVNELFHSLYRLVLARVNDNTITIIEHDLNSPFLLDKINKLLYKLEGNIEDRYLRKIENTIITQQKALEILENALKKLDKSSSMYKLALKNYNRLKVSVENKE